MSEDNADEIRLDDHWRSRPIRMFVSNQAYRNAAGIGFSMHFERSDEHYVADLSSVVFRRVRLPAIVERPNFITEIPVDLDLSSGSVHYLAELTEGLEMHRISEAERKAVREHVQDLRNVTSALIDMQKTMIRRGDS